MSASRTGNTPTQLQLVFNDLDFHYTPERTSLVATRHSDLVCTVDVGRCFSKGVHHIVFALDCTGGQGSYNPHCGPLLRRGANLLSEARGFIVFGDGAVMAERWNGTAMPLVVAVDNTSGQAFNPGAHPIFTVHIQAGYRAGALANRMRIRIHQGITVDGPVLFAGEVAGDLWGWDGTGVHKAAIAAIAAGFVPPSTTGCVEEILPRSAPEAVLPFAGFKLRVVSSS